LSIGIVITLSRANRLKLWKYRTSICLAWATASSRSSPSLWSFVPETALSSNSSAFWTECPFPIAASRQIRCWSSMLVSRWESDENLA
jgi:hypothetical protein